MSDDALIAHARRLTDDKQARGVYPADLLEALAEPLDLRPDPAVAGGVAWPEALRTAHVGVGPVATSTRPLIGPLLTFAKKAMARALRWYLPPVAEQISRHNQAVLEVLESHNREIVRLRMEIRDLQGRIKELERNQ